MGRVRAAPFASTLSFIFPGLGQAALGRYGRALLFALPVIFTIGVVVTAAWSVVAEPDEALDALLRPETIALMVGIDSALFLWHLVSIADAERLARSIRPVRGVRHVLATTVLGAVLVATVALHGTVGLVGAEAGDTLSAVFVGDGPDASFAIPEPELRDPRAELRGG